VFEIIAEDLGIEYDSDTQSIQELIAEIDNKAVVFAVSTYEHSGISMFLGVKNGWDYSQVGFMYLAKSKFENYGIDSGLDEEKQRECVKERFNDELETYNAYLSNQVYGAKVTIRAEVGNVTDVEVLEDYTSGFYGLNNEESGIFEFFKENSFIDGEEIDKKISQKIIDGLDKLGESHTSVEVERIYTPNDIPSELNKDVREAIKEELESRKIDFLLNEFPSSVLTEKLCEYADIKKDGSHFVEKHEENISLKSTRNPDENLFSISPKELLEKETKPLIEPEVQKKDNKNSSKIKR
jgi:hypothetical protein